MPIHAYLFSGEFFESVEDLRIPGRGVDFVWVRKYRSRLGPDTAQGSHWDFSYNIRIEAVSDAQLKLFNGDAREDIFTEQPDGTFIRDEFFIVGSKNSDGTFTFTFPDNGTWNFFALDGRPEQGKINRIIDRDGNLLAFHYDSSGRLTEIIDTLDRQIRIAYNADSFIESLTDFTGRQVRYAYYRDDDDDGSAGDLRSVTRPTVVGTPNGNDFPNGKSTTYTYSNHKLLTITDSKGQTCLKNTYSRTKDPEKSDFDRLQRQVWGNDRDIIDIAYLPQVPEPQNNHAVIVAIVNDRNRNVKEYFYDAKDRCVLVREYTGRAPRNSPTTLTANRPTRRLRNSDPEFFEVRYGWNKDSLLTRILLAGGNVIEKDYEGDLNPNAEQRLRGNLRAVRFLPGPLGGDQPSIVRLFEYQPGFGCSCAENFVSKATDARGNITLRQFDDRGRVLRTQHRLPSIVEEFEYNQFGQLIRQVHPDNGSGHRRVDSFTYYTEADGHQNGYLKERIIDADGLALTTTYEYDAVGNVTRITDPGGHDSLYVWNQLDQLVRELSAPLNDRGERNHVDFFYDANDNNIRIDVENRDEEGRVQQNPLLTTTRDFDILNRCIRVTKQSEPNHRVSVVFAYDGNGNRTTIRHGEATNGKQPANVLSIIYDERNLVFQRKRAPQTKFQATTQYDYDRNHNLVRILSGVEDAPREHRQTFDGFDRLISVTEPLGSTIRHRYDANGNLISRQVSAGQAPDGSESRIWFQAASQFDAMDRPVIDEIFYFDADSQPIGKGKAVTRTEYSDNSAVIRTIDDNGHETRTVYDSANRERDIIDHKGNITSYDYDRGSNVARITVLEKSDTGKPDQKLITTRDYDNLDRPVRVTDNLGNTYRYGYDSRDNLTLSIDALGNTTRFEYDGLNRLKSLTRFLTDNAAQSGAIVTAQEWDDSSRLVSRTDPNGNVTRYSYDPLNREISVKHADGSVLSHIYDVHGNGLITRDPNGSVVTTRYDLRNRPIHRSIKTGGGVSKIVTRETYEYDPLSRLTRAENDRSVVTRSYDSLSHVIREDLNGRVVKSVYDGVGNKLRCVYPSGREIAFEYDELNRKTKIADDHGTIASYSYIGPSRVERRVTLAPPSGADTNYEYDELKRLRRITRAAGDQEYSWDAMSNKTRCADLRGSTTVLSHEYRYDSAYRLSDSQTSDATGQRVRATVYALDAAGSRVSVRRSGSSGRYTMRSADRSVNQYTTTPFDHRRYDKNGNLISIADAGRNTQEITYDYRNLMATYTDKERGIVSNYLYDALGRRIATSTHADSNQVTHYFYDDLQNVEEQDGNGNTLATYVYGTSLNDLVNMRRASGDFYYHSDDLCSTVAITDRELKLVERYHYDDFGEPSIFDSTGNAIRNSSVDNPYLFTGQRYDSDTGFYYYRARYLDPRVGRFTTRDPIGMWEDAGNSGNAYTYVRNNPLTFVDPKGELIRTISCPGPWPGPRQVKIEYEGCHLARRVGLDDPVCRAFRASGRSASDVGTLWLSDFSGQTLPTKTGKSLSYIRQRVKFWFGGADNATSTYSKSVIMNYLDNVFDAFKENDVDIDCEGGCGGEVAYVNHGGQYDVNLCAGFFDDINNFTNKKKAAILVHELTHAYSETDDKCYYPNDGSNLPWNLIFETPDLRENADTYDQFVLGDYV